MSIELKIKAKHLALEPQIIRHEERKLKKRIRHTIQNGGVGSNERYLIENKLNSLVDHRKGPLREEARATHLARSYIAGMSYKDVENKRKPCNEYAFENRVLKRVLSMVQKYHDMTVSIEDIKKWCSQ